MITFQQVTTQSLHEFEMSVDKGQAVWISCDRRTAQDLVDLLTGKIEPMYGKMEIEGQSISNRKDRIQYRKQIGYCSHQWIGWDHWTVERTLKYMQKIRKTPYDPAALRMAGLYSHRHTRMRMLSYVDRIKVILISQLRPCSLMVVDELFSQMSLQEAMSVQGLLKQWIRTFDLCVVYIGKTPFASIRRIQIEKGYVVYDQ